MSDIVPILIAFHVIILPVQKCKDRRDTGIWATTTESGIAKPVSRKGNNGILGLIRIREKLSPLRHYGPEQHHVYA